MFLIYIYGVRGLWVQMSGGLEVRALVILVLLKFIWNAPEVSLVHSAFEDTGFLGFPPRRMAYPPGSTLGD